MKKTILLLFILPLFAFSVHKYYVALTEIEYNAKNKSVEMIMNVFVDDIELALNDDYQIKPSLNTPKELKNIDEYFKKYINQHFKISINGKQKSYNFIGKEYNGNVVFFYLEIESIEDFKTIEVKNTILVKQFTEQQNLVKVKVNKTRKSLFLSREEDKGMLNF